MSGPFDLDGPLLSDSREFVVTPSFAGGDDIQPRNHVRSWPIEQLPTACAHTLLTLATVYGFTEDDPLRVGLEPFT